MLAAPADDLVHALKYEGWLELGPFMGRAIARSARALTVDLVVPVPTTAGRRRRRGYDQAGVLADAVGTALGRPVVRLLERPVESRSQTALGPTERRANVDGAFRMRGGADVRGRRVLLVDDVLTTGATAGAVAGVLRAAGAGRVSVATFARAIPEPDSGLS